MCKNVSVLTFDFTIIINFSCVTGPFTSSEMAEWFSAGYFTMNLQVKRGCDERYSPLGMDDILENSCVIILRNISEL